MRLFNLERGLWPALLTRNKGQASTGGSQPAIIYFDVRQFERPAFGDLPGQLKQQRPVGRRKVNRPEQQLAGGLTDFARKTQQLIGGKPAKMATELKLCALAGNLPVRAVEANLVQHQIHVQLPVRQACPAPNPAFEKTQPGNFRNDGSKIFQPQPLEPKLKGRRPGKVSVRPPDMAGSRQFFNFTGLAQTICRPKFRQPARPGRATRVLPGKSPLLAPGPGRPGRPAPAVYFQASFPAANLQFVHAQLPAAGLASRAR